MDTQSDTDILKIIDSARVIAIVGASNNPVRPSLFVATYFNSRGKRIIPVNPALVGQSLFGSPFVASLAEIPSNAGVDMVDIFRSAEHVPAIVDEALAHLMPGLRTIWMQYGVRHEAAAARARAAGLDVVEDKCPKVEHMRLSGSPLTVGVKTGAISSRLPPLPSRD